MSVKFDFKGKKVCVTGCNGHLGRALVHEFTSSHATVVGIDKTNPEGDFKSNELFIFEQVDLENDEERRELCAEITERYHNIDVLINNAAFVGTSKLEGWGVSFEKQTIETWRRAVEVNMTSVFALCQGLYAALKRSNAASIINIGSIYAHLGPDWSLYEGTEMANPAAYAASKGGVLQLTRWLATTVEQNVRVNSVSPGGIFRDQPSPFVQKFTKRTPLGRMSSEMDVVGPILFLASDLSKYITGQDIKVDGGWSSW